jgi:hypothetical protein
MLRGVSVGVTDAGGPVFSPGLIVVNQGRKREGRLFRSVAVLGIRSRRLSPLERVPSRYRGSTDSFPWRAGASHTHAPYIRVKTAIGVGDPPQQTWGSWCANLQRPGVWVPACRGYTVRSLYHLRNLS